MSIARRIMILILLTLCATGPAFGQANNAPRSDRPPPVDRPPPAAAMPLADLLEIAQKNTGRTYLVDFRAPPLVVTAQLDTDDLDYNRLLLILQNNNLAAVNIDGVVNVVPAAVVRQYALPVIAAQDDSINDEEWVTWTIQTRGDAAQYVPILRPLMPSAGHLAAHPETNSILIVDRYGNAKRLVAVIRQLDGR